MWASHWVWCWPLDQYNDCIISQTQLIHASYLTYLYFYIFFRIFLSHTVGSSVTLVVNNVTLVVNNGPASCYYAVSGLSKFPVIHQTAINNCWSVCKHSIKPGKQRCKIHYFNSQKSLGGHHNIPLCHPSHFWGNIGSKLQHDKTKNSISWGFRYTHLTASCSIVYTVPPEAYLVAGQIRAATEGLMSLQYLLFLSFCSSSCSSRFFSFDDFCELLENNKQPLNQYTAIW